MKEGDPQRIVLVGFMGSGKSTVAPLLAGLLQWGFLDMDERIEAAVGLSIAQIFEQKGASFFREQERHLAGEIQGLERHVIAAGGGAFASTGTRQILQFGATTVWLRCTIDVILKRIGNDPRRPLASNRETMRKLLAEREPMYRLADFSIETSGATAPDVAERIMRLVLAKGTANS